VAAVAVAVAVPRVRFPFPFRPTNPKGSRFFFSFE
jgi:hypothetical protein